MNVNIYIKYYLKGNFSGQGKAVAILEYKKKNNELHTRLATTEQTGTKNELVLKILIESLTLLKPCDVTVYIKDTYIKGILTRDLLNKWEKNEWKNTKGKTPSNLSLWKEVYHYLGYHKVTIKDYIPKYEQELNGLLERKKYGG